MKIPRINPKSWRYRTSSGVLLAAHLSFAPALYSQDDASEDEVYELSPFVVDASKDTGYRAENTLAGSRMNMSLADVAQSVNVLTAEFLEDVGAEDLDDILLYSLNAEEDFNESSSVEDAIGSDTEYYGNAKTNIRGNAASITVDNNLGGGSLDTYNTSRITISQGPNAILFGFGGAGGLINLSTQRASASRDSMSLQTQIGSFDQFRNILNINKVLIQDRLAIKAITLHEESAGWRAGDTTDTLRSTFILTARPFAGTEINANYEKGHVDKQFTVKQGATDSFTEWLNYYGTEEYEGFYGDGTYAQVTTPARAGARNRRLASQGLSFASNQLVFIDNLDFEAEGLPTDVGNLLPMQGFARTRAVNPNEMFSSDQINLAAFTPFGKDSYRNENIENYKLGLVQRITPDLFLNLEYFNSENSAPTISPAGNGVSIYAEPMKVFDGIYGASALDGMANPFGPSEDGYWLYSEATLQRSNTFINDSTYRASLGYRLNTERWGNHSFNLAMDSKERSRRKKDEFETIDFQGAYQQRVNLEDYGWHLASTRAQNRIVRRHYYKAGPDGLPLDQNEISVGSLSEPVSMLVHDVDGNPVMLESVWTPTVSQGRRTVENYKDGTVLAMTNKWFKNRLVTTLGLRKTDEETVIYSGLRANAAVLLDEEGNPLFNEDGTYQLSDEAARPYIWTDPFTGELTHQAFSPLYQSSVPTEIKDGKSSNKTLGIVYKATDWLSLTYNQSTNRQDQDAFAVVLPGVLAPSPDGEGRDIGIRMKLFDNKLNVTVNYFENSANNFLSRSGTKQMVNAYRYLWTQFENAQAGFSDFYTDEEGNYTDADGVVLESGAEPVVNPDSVLLPLPESHPQFFSAEERDAIEPGNVVTSPVDKASSGYDLRIHANPTKNWSIVLNWSDMLSYSAEGLFDEDLPWYEEQYAAARERYDALLAEGDGYGELFNSFVVQNNANRSYLKEAHNVEYLRLAETDPEAAAEFLYGLDPIDRIHEHVMEEIFVNKMAVEDSSMGASKKKASMFTTYKFRDGGLKGLSIGGGFSWREGRILNRFFEYEQEDGSIELVTKPVVEWGDPDGVKEYQADDDFKLNIMASYKTKMKLLGADRVVKFQFNANNILEPDYQVNPLRYQVDGTVRKYQIIGPRTWKLKTTIEF
ncbi:TonB-dependent receptor plug domain-containing protein [Pelagicoccus sp. SDUM812005]|uniref:TonB-dependent receptor plug domain-containing protein n=1 Tax=Pelagicoccus sp. SDUM812005 TaxID=3041257 RepID=UPI00280EA770|nr:TonB-dependent receptor plug domain-containing protein [Pelagicoccus sp. SDUM812005]MDQ8179581.1 hypothetical protein [Pelagicoccus sp. SDUM812005]